MADKLFYDGNCPLCSAEMARLEKIKDSDLILQDIHQLQQEELPATKEQLLKVLHLEREGKMITGIEANVAAWEHTRYGALWKVLTWPLIKPLASAAYSWWAIKRYRRMYP